MARAITLFVLAAATILSALALSALAWPLAAQGRAFLPEKPAVYVVSFTAAWCPNCRVLDPMVAEVRRTSLHRSAEFVTFDFSNDKSWDATTELAIEKDLVSVYNGYAGVTGLAAIVAADTGEVITCVNRSFTTATIGAAIDRAIERTKSAPQGRRGIGDIVCPRRRAAPG
jgi:thiol-disulfide isomerase/thioredoxin